MEPQKELPLPDGGYGASPAPASGRGSTRDLAAASSAATTSLICGILGVVVCALLGIVAIIQGKKAKEGLQPEDSAYGMAQASLILGWVSVGLGAVGIVLVFLYALFIVAMTTSGGFGSW